MAIELVTPSVWMDWPPTCTAPNTKATAATPDGRISASAATMIPAKPYPLDRPGSSRVAVPVSSTAPASPAKAPDSTSAVSTLRCSEMPAYRAVAGEEPAMRSS